MSLILIQSSVGEGGVGREGARKGGGMEEGEREGGRELKEEAREKAEQCRLYCVIQPQQENTQLLF